MLWRKIMGFNLRRGLTSKLQKENGKTPTSQYVNPDNIDLNNKIVCITGTIPGMTRFEAERKLKNRFPNIIFAGSVSVNTDCLITGFGMGQTKLNKAQRLGIPMIDAIMVFL
jgi:NAD-dependent DNA ligase